MLPETSSFKKVLLSPKFLVGFLGVNVASVIFVYVLQKVRIQSSSAPAVLVDRSTFVDIMSFTLMIAGVVFSRSTDITSVIASGGSPPLSVKCLSSLPGPLGGLCGTTGDRSIISFILFCLVFPGLVVTALLYVCSFVINGGENVLYWVIPLNKYLIINSAVHAFITSIIYTINYIAAHNPTQSVLVSVVEE